MRGISLHSSLHLLTTIRRLLNLPSLLRIKSVKPQRSSQYQILLFSLCLPKLKLEFQHLHHHDLRIQDCISTAFREDSTVTSHLFTLDTLFRPYQPPYLHFPLTSFPSSPLVLPYHPHSISLSVSHYTHICPCNKRVS